jgi:DNA polymerase I-like protein with 3'-5' exonuclease and polymerase domains
VAYLDTFDFQMKMTRLFMEIGQRGILVDQAEKQHQSELAQRQLDIWLSKFVEIVGVDFNPNSYPQVTNELYVVRGMPVQYNRDKYGKYVPTSDENALKKLVYEYPNDPFLRLMMKWRKLSKLKTTYLDALVDSDGRLRCSVGWNKTGRINTSKNPFGTGMNLQNQPRNPITLEDVVDELTGELGVINIKSMFIASPGCWLIEADGKQAESRIVAYWSEDKNYIRLFETGADIHSLNATALLGKLVTKKDKIERHLGKKASHGAPYGIGVHEVNEGIIKEMGIDYALPEWQLEKFFKEYFERFPGVKTGYQDRIVEMLKQGLPLTNPLGRVRKPLGVLDHKTFKEMWAQIPQSTVPDLINRGILEWEVEPYRSRNIPTLLQVHDSAMFETPKYNCNDRLYDLIKEVFEIPIQIWIREITIPMEIKAGYRWSTMEEVA